jgi:hypothetical protein
LRALGVLIRPPGIPVRLVSGRRHPGPIPDAIQAPFLQDVTEHLLKV